MLRHAGQPERRRAAVRLALALQALPLLAAVPITLLANLPERLLYVSPRIITGPGGMPHALDPPPPLTPLAINLAWAALPLACGWAAGYLALGAPCRYAAAWLAVAALLAAPWAGARLGLPLPAGGLFLLLFLIQLGLLIDAARLAGRPAAPRGPLPARLLTLVILPVGPALVAGLLLGAGLWQAPARPPLYPCPLSTPVPTVGRFFNVRLDYCRLLPEPTCDQVPRYFRDERPTAAAFADWLALAPAADPGDWVALRVETGCEPAALRTWIADQGGRLDPFIARASSAQARAYPIAPWRWQFDATLPVAALPALLEQPGLLRLSPREHLIYGAALTPILDDLMRASFQPPPDAATRYASLLRAVPGRPEPHLPLRLRLRGSPDGTAWLLRLLQQHRPLVLATARHRAGTVVDVALPLDEFFRALAWLRSGSPVTAMSYLP
jgi:hypothetical protein